MALDLEVWVTFVLQALWLYSVGSLLYLLCCKPWWLFTVASLGCSMLLQALVALYKLQALVALYCCKPWWLTFVSLVLQALVVLYCCKPWLLYTVASLGGSILLQALVALYCCKPWWLYTVASLGGSILLQALVALLWKPWEPMLKWFIVQCGFFGVGLAQK